MDTGGAGSVGKRRSDLKEEDEEDPCAAEKLKKEKKKEELSTWLEQVVHADEGLTV